MCDFVDGQKIIEFADLMAYARVHRFDWFELLCDNSAYVMGAYIKSRRHRKREQ